LGATALCTTVVIEENEVTSSANVYPNPAKKFISTTFKININVYTTIYSADGKVAYKSMGIIKPQIDISKLPAGLYLFEIKSRDGNILQQNKLIKD
jgi:hypothetical protein